MDEMKCRLCGCTAKEYKCTKTSRKGNTKYKILNGKECRFTGIDGYVRDICVCCDAKIPSLEEQRKNGELQALGYFY